MSLVEQIEILRKESARRIGSMATIVLVTSLVMLVLGLLWNEKYESSATILIEDEKIIGRLLEDTTVPSGARNRPVIERDRAELALEVLHDRDVINRALEEGGWLTDDLTPIQRAELVDLLRKRLEVSNVGSNVIEIALRDPSPERAFRTVLALTDLFINRAHEAKAQESRAAYAFISAETERYRDKLHESERRLQAFYAKNGNLRPGAGESVDTRVTELLQNMQETALDLETARVRVRSLEAQLNGDNSGVAADTQRDRIRSAIADLELQLAELRLQYHDTYPDIVSTQHKIEALHQQLQRLDSGEPGSAPANNTFINPMHREIRAALSEARIEAAALEERLARNEAWLAEERSRGVEVSGAETEAAELTREYEVTKAFYQDLLQRRENARIAMNMAENSEDVTMSIQESPTVPLHPSGLRFVHFAALGPLLGLGFALGHVFVRVRFDERIRTSSTISRELQIPVLATVPMLVDEEAQHRQRRVRGTVIAAALMLLACYALVITLRMSDSI